MISFFTNPRKIILLFIDIILSFAAIFFASPAQVWMAISLNIIPTQHLKLLFPFLVIRSAVFMGFKFYSKFWEYSTLEDLIEIVKGCSPRFFFSYFLHILL